MNNKPKYESTDRAAEMGAVNFSAVTIAGTKYVVPYEVAKYISSLQSDRDKFVTYREMTAKEMGEYVANRARAIVDALNNNYPRYNPGKLYLAKKIDAQDFDTMNALCDLVKRVIFDTANKAPGTDPHAEGLTEEV